MDNPIEPMGLPLSNPDNAIAMAAMETDAAAAVIDSNKPVISDVDALTRFMTERSSVTGTGSNAYLTSVANVSLSGNALDHTVVTNDPFLVINPGSQRDRPPTSHDDSANRPL